jgi:hypothetical protein
MASCSSRTFAQLQSPERLAVKNLERKKWNKAKESLQKSLGKDSINAAGRFLMAVYFFTPQNPAFNIDSASAQLEHALIDLATSTQKEKERMQRLQIDSIAVIKLKTAIDSAAFHRARIVDSEESYLTFILQFPTSKEIKEAVRLRDEAAYQKAARANTYQSFFAFLEKYPGSPKANIARQNYERLIYESKTSTHDLKSYETFLKDHPASPYRKIVEGRIYELTTAPGYPRDFTTFINRYPHSSFAPYARNILFHLTREDSNGRYDRYWNDSLKNITTLNESFLIPTFKDGKFGFMDNGAHIVLKPQFSNIHSDYICGNVTTDILLVDHQLIARNGGVIVKDSVEDYIDIGEGFLLVESKACKQVVHKSGIKVGGCADDAKLLARNYIAIQKNGKWAIYGLSGLKLTDSNWEKITAIEEQLVFEKDKHLQISNVQNISRLAEGYQVQFAGPFSDVKRWTADLIIVQTGDSYGIIDQQMNYVVPLQQQQITRVFNGTLVKPASNKKYTLYDDGMKLLGTYDQVLFNKPFIAFKKDSLWRISSKVLRQSRPYDSVRFSGPFTFGIHADSADVYFPGGERITISKNAASYFIPGTDSSVFLVNVPGGKKKTVFDDHGKILFQYDFDGIQYAGEGAFVITKKDKKGLLDREGNLLLPTEYDAIGSSVSHIVSLLKNSKFGAYHLKDKKLIKPKYEKNISAYSDHYVVVFLKGFYGFADWSNKLVVQPEFDEITFWNDTAALVRKNFEWKIFDIRQKKVYEDHIKNIKQVSDDENGHLVIVQQENSLGVLNNRHGVTIPATFSYIVNVGSADEPIFFTEKHVEEAGIFVVIYYDKHGRMLHRQVFEEREYEEIFCSDR